MKFKHKLINDDGTKTEVKVVRYELTTHAPVVLAFSVAPFDNGMRQVALSVLDSSGEYRALDDTLDIPTSQNVEDGAYYVSMVHDKENATFTTTGLYMFET